MVDVLLKYHVEFVIVGAYAAIFHGNPRLTEDIDFLVRPTPENTRRLRSALQEFGSPVNVERECLDPDEVIQIGLKPVRVDILASVSGVSTETIWARRTAGKFEGRDVSYIPLDLLIENKLAAGRSKDLLDVESLRRVQARGQGSTKEARKGD